MKREFDNEQLKELINQIMAAMKADFGVQYSKQFAKNADIGGYKVRLYEKFNGENLADLADGYEIYVGDNHKYPPNLSQLIDYSGRAKKERLARERVQEEVARVNALPGPKQTIDCDPVAMLAAAKSNAEKEDDLTTEERANRLAELMQNHLAILTLNRHLLRKPKFNPVMYSCAYSGCGKLGALSDSTRGEGPYYCGSHALML